MFSPVVSLGLLSLLLKTGVSAPTGAQDAPEPITCALSVQEYWTCDPADSNLYAQMQIRDAKANSLIYPRTAAELAQNAPVPVNVKDHANITGVLSQPLEINASHVTAESMWFAYGDLKWSTTEPKRGPPRCTLVGPDWTFPDQTIRGPACGSPSNATLGHQTPGNLTRTFYCEFPCNLAG